jgi:hypothetical protein
VNRRRDGMPVDSLVTRARFNMVGNSRGHSKLGPAKRTQSSSSAVNARFVMLFESGLGSEILVANKAPVVCGKGGEVQYQVRVTGEP